MRGGAVMGFRYANPRNWTSQEVLEAIARIKDADPQLWEEIVRIERTTGEFTGTATHDSWVGLLAKLYPPPEYDLNARIDLYLQIRMHVERMLGLCPKRFAGKIQNNNH